MENFLYLLFSGLISGGVVAFINGFINRNTVKTTKIIEKAVALAIEEHGRAFEARAKGLAGAMVPHALTHYVCGNVVFLFKLHGLKPPTLEKMLEAIECEKKMVKELRGRFSE
jgi:hypothetical protein